MIRLDKSSLHLLQNDRWILGKIYIINFFIRNYLVYAMDLPFFLPYSEVNGNNNIIYSHFIRLSGTYEPTANYLRKHEYLFEAKTKRNY